MISVQLRSISVADVLGPGVHLMTMWPTDCLRHLLVLLALGRMIARRPPGMYRDRHCDFHPASCGWNSGALGGLVGDAATCAGKFKRRPTAHVETGQ